MTTNQDVGFLTEGARRIFHYAKWFSVMPWLRPFNPLFRPRSELKPDEFGKPDFTRRRARAIDLYVTVWLVAELLTVGISCSCQLPCTVHFLVMVFVSLRILEIVQVTVNVALFDALSGRPEELVGSRTRMLVLAGLNFLELLLCFGIIYAINYRGLVGAGQPATGFYLSVMTQLTIGYGDVYPTAWLRLVAAMQGLVGTFFLILVVARFVASLPQLRGAFDGSARRRPARPLARRRRTRTRSSRSQRSRWEQ